MKNNLETLARQGLIQMNEPASEESIREVKLAVPQVPIREELEQLWRGSNGLMTSSSILIYDTLSFAEQNEQHEISVLLPGHALIGNDSGDLAIIVDAAGGHIYSAPFEDLRPSMLRRQGEALLEWLLQGAPLSARETFEENFATLILGTMPEGGPRALMTILNELSIPHDARFIRKLMASIPVELVASVSRTQYDARVRSLNARFGNCLFLRARNS